MEGLTRKQKRIRTKEIQAEMAKVEALREAATEAQDGTALASAEARYAKLLRAKEDLLSHVKQKETRKGRYKRQRSS